MNNSERNPSTKRKRAYKIVSSIWGIISISFYLLSAIIPFPKGNAISIIQNMWSEQISIITVIHFVAMVGIAVSGVAIIIKYIRLFSISHNDEKKYAEQWASINAINLCLVISLAVHIMMAGGMDFFPLKEFINENPISATYIGLFLIAFPIGGTIIRKTFKDVGEYNAKMIDEHLDDELNQVKNEIKKVQEQAEKDEEALYTCDCDEHIDDAASKIQDMDTLLKYKKLLDDGVITQEEFDKKKKELLK